MGLRLFSSKGGRRLRKKQERPVPDGPPPEYAAQHYRGSPSTIRPAAPNLSDERLSLASTLRIESSVPVTNGIAPPRYTAVDNNREALGILPNYPASARRPSLRPLPPLEGPLFPDEPSSFIVPNFSTPTERLISSTPPAIWGRIAEYGTLADAANLALSSKTLRYRLGSRPLKALGRPENRKEKIKVLVAFDKDYPDHLLCFLCTRYHHRLSPGDERLQPPNNLVTKPVYDCPNSTEMAAAKIRLTHGRVLPFTLVQLAMRAERHSPEHGIPMTNLSRRWKCKDSKWVHATRTYSHEGHLLFRSYSTCFAAPNLTPSEERLLLYSRTDYIPYFSVCEHWHKCDLMSYCKCALSHVPERRENLVEQLKKSPGISLSKIRTNQFPKQCDECKPIRRCPFCPTEYLIEIKFVEDPNDQVNRFKHALCVTRWSDFGECKNPFDLEWASCSGEERINSFALVTHATLSTIFETAVSNCAPTPKVMGLKRGGHVY